MEYQRCAECEKKFHNYVCAVGEKNIQTNEMAKNNNNNRRIVRTNMQYFIDGNIIKIMCNIMGNVNEQK